MKDEEMAEEYKESKRHKCFRADVGKIQIDYETYLNNLKDGFLAGFKAGRQPVEEAVEIIRELGGIVREGVTCHYLTDCGEILHRATLFLKEYAK